MTMTAGTLTDEEAPMSCARGCCATQREHYKSLVFGTPPAESDKFDGGYTKHFDADMNAYVELRRGGVQPERVDGLADLLRQVSEGVHPVNSPDIEVVPQ
jgi:hypothetical protein